VPGRLLNLAFPGSGCPRVARRSPSIPRSQPPAVRILDAWGRQTLFAGAGGASATEIVPLHAKNPVAGLRVDRQLEDQQRPGTSARAAAQILLQNPTGPGRQLAPRPALQLADSVQYPTSGPTFTLFAACSTDAPLHRLRTHYTAWLPLTSTTVARRWTWRVRVGRSICRWWPPGTSSAWTPRRAL